MMEGEGGVGFDWATARHKMVESQLRPVGVSDLRLLARFARVERERYVPADARALAYADTLVPLGGGRAMNPPMATALLIQAGEPRLSDRTLLIGPGTGYAAAILAPLVATLVALEDGELELLQPERDGVTATQRIVGPLIDGHAAGAPYDLVVIDGAVDAVPDAIVAQMAPGSRLVTGLIVNCVGRLCAGRRVGDGLSLRPLMEATVAELPAFATPAGFVF